MNIIERVKEILITPKLAWTSIATEETDTATLYTRYIMILAAIPAVAGFIGMSLVGSNLMGISVRVPIVTGLVQMVSGYAMGLAMIYVAAMIASALAPGFYGQKSQMNALKLVAYSATAAMLGGIFALIPALGVLALVASLYSLYLLYLGVPTLMKVPREKALPYTAVLVICVIVLGAVAGALTSVVSGGPASMGSTSMGSTSQTDSGARSSAPFGRVAVETPSGTVNIDTAKMETWGKRMEEIGKQLEKAQQSGDQAAMERAIKEMSVLQLEQPPVTR